MNPREFSDLLIKKKIATSEELRGCSETEIEQLEKHIGDKLPQTYREFLMLMGHDAGDFMRGTDYSYKSVFDLTAYARDTMMNGPFQLPDDAFVFSSHQGYFFTYFRLSEGDDPPIYAYMEDDITSKKCASNFVEYLAGQLRNI